MTSEEKQLIKGCCDGDRKAQEGLYRKYSGQMYAICLRYSKSQQEAEDILQEAFVKVFDQIRSFRAESKLVFWIKKIVINTALNSERSKLYLYPMIDVHEMKEHGEVPFSLADFTMEELLKMISSLPSSCQTIFNLYAIEGYKHHEIAELLGISVGTSKSQYSRARMLLQEQITELNRQYERG